MPHDRGPEALPVFGRCLLCDDTERAPVAACLRYGAFVCREHVLRLVHPPSRRPVGLAAPAKRKETGRLEMVYEVCYLGDLAARERAV